MPLRQSGLAPNFKLTFIVKTDSRCTHPNTTGNRWTHNPLLMPPYQSALHRHLHIRVVAAPQQFVFSACMEPSPYSNQPSNLNKYKPYSLIRRHRTCRTSEHAKHRLRTCDANLHMSHFFESPPKQPPVSCAHKEVAA